MQNNYSYKFTETAKADTASVLEYIKISLCNTKASMDLYSKIEKTIENICAFPRSFHDCKSLLIDSDDIRCAIIDNYALIYEIVESEKTVNILRFVYAKMDLSNLFKL